MLKVDREPKLYRKHRDERLHVKIRLNKEYYHKLNSKKVINLPEIEAKIKEVKVWG